MQENKIIEDIVNNAAQKLKEKYIITHYPELYDKIINFTINTNSILEFKQKFWHYINNEKNIPGCRHTSQRFCSTFNFTQPHPKPTHHPTSGQLTI